MAKIRTEDFIQALRARGLKVRAGRGGQYYAQCPAHDDRNPSLSIKDEGGYAVFKCHAGCEYGEIVKALGIDGGDAVSHDRPRRGRPPKQTHPNPLGWLASYCGIEAEWVKAHPYLGAKGGAVVFTFIQRGEVIAEKFREAGSKRIWWGEGGLTPILWPLVESWPEHIILTEGETDALILQRCGLDAFAITKGAGAGLDADTARLLYRAGVRSASIVFDADDAGQKGAARTAAALEAAGIRVRILDIATFFTAPLGLKDIRDLWLIDREATLRLIDHAKAPVAGRQGPKLIDAQSLLDLHIPLPTWLVSGLVPEGGLTVLGGDPKIGKTWLALQIARAVACGGPVLHGRAMKTGPVIYLTFEDGIARLRARMDHQGWRELGDKAKNVMVGDGTGIDLLTAEGRAKVVEMVKEVGAKLVIIDTLKAALRGGAVKENEAEFSNALYLLRDVVKAEGAALLIIHHHKKNKTGDVGHDMRGTSAIAGAADMMLGLYKKEEGKVLMEIRGRDLPTGDVQMIVRMRPDCVWEAAEKDELNSTQKAILDVLRSGPRGRKEIVAALNLPPTTVYEALSKLENKGLIVHSQMATGGRPAFVYALATEAIPASRMDAEPHGTAKVATEKAPTPEVAEVATERADTLATAGPTPESADVATEKAPPLATEGAKVAIPFMAIERGAEMAIEGVDTPEASEVATEPNPLGEPRDIYDAYLRTLEVRRRMLDKIPPEHAQLISPLFDAEAAAVRDWFMGEGDTIKLPELVKRYNEWRRGYLAKVDAAIREGEAYDPREAQYWANVLHTLLAIHEDDLGEVANLMREHLRELRFLDVFADIWNNQLDLPPLLNILRKAFYYAMRGEGDYDALIHSAAHYAKAPGSEDWAVASVLVFRTVQCAKAYRDGENIHPLAIYPSPASLGLQLDDRGFFVETS